MKAIFWLGWVWVVLAQQSLASELSERPFFRIQAESHTAPVRVIRYDAAGRRAVTVSLDKTVRVWKLPEWLPERVIHLPAGPRLEGTGYAVAVSPDGRLFAVGGWTGFDVEGASSVYLFDLDTGRMLHRYRQLPGIVSYLAYSRDGQKLAVGLSSGQGVRIFNAQTHQLLSADTEYGGTVMFLEYGQADNSLVTTSNDGYIRVYREDHTLLVRQPMPYSKQMGGARLSPDGGYLAVGYMNLPKALVIQIPDMRIVAELDGSAHEGQESLCCPAWTLDGKRLVMTGRYSGPGDTPFFDYDARNFELLHITPAAPQRVHSMFPMEDGSVIYATEDPSLGVLDNLGRRIKLIESPIADFRQGALTFKASADGHVIGFNLNPTGNRRVLFSVSNLSYLAEDSDKNTLQSTGSRSDLVALQNTRQRLQAAIRASNGFAVRKTDDYSTFFDFAGKTVNLLPREVHRSHALSADGQLLAIGTEWRLVIEFSDGRPARAIDLPGIAWNVLVTADKKWVIATLGDGSVRWYDAQTAEEKLALFVHRTGQDWVLWRPDGYYAASEQGDNLVGWSVNRGLDQAPRFYKAVQFERIFYRPDLLKQQLSAQPEDSLDGSDQTASFSLERFAEIQPATIEIQHRALRHHKGRVWLDLRLQLKEGAVPSEELGVYLNGLPMLATGQRALLPGAGHRELNLSVPMNDTLAALRIEVLNGRSMGLTESYVQWTPGKGVPEPKPAKGKLYVVAVGINEFKDLPDQTLEFAAKDAQALSAALQRYSAGAFDAVEVQLIGDGAKVSGNKVNILKALKSLSRVGPDDTVLVFLASHGFSDRRGNYFFMPSDASSAEVQALLRGEPLPSTGKTLISWEDLFDSFRQASGRRLLVVDTCHARGTVGTFDAHSLKKRSAASQFGLMVAARQGEAAQEYQEGQHGLFTYALLEALKGKADQNKDKKIDLQESFRFVSQQVFDLQDPSATTTQTPDLIAPTVLKESILAIARESTP